MTILTPQQSALLASLERDAQDARDAVAKAREYQQIATYTAWLTLTERVAEAIAAGIPKRRMYDLYSPTGNGKMPGNLINEWLRKLDAAKGNSNLATPTSGPSGPTSPNPPLNRGADARVRVNRDNLVDYLTGEDKGDYYRITATDVPPHVWTAPPAVQDVDGQPWSGHIDVVWYVDTWLPASIALRRDNEKWSGNPLHKEYMTKTTGKAVNAWLDEVAEQFKAGSQ